MKHNNCELRILVKGKPIREYEHEGNVFVEGRKGSDFELEFLNYTDNRVLFVPSVDGVNIIDGKVATADSNGYLVGMQSSIRIPGWKTGSDSAAKFFFKDKKGAYAKFAVEGGAKNVGVIGALVYSEKPALYTPPVQIDKPWLPNPMPYPMPHPRPYPRPWKPYDPFLYGFPQNTQTLRGIASSNGMMSASAAHADALGGSTAAPAPQQLHNVNIVQPEERFELGTGFGHKTEFKTFDTAFRRNVVISHPNIYYDSRRNLVKRGIIILEEVFDSSLPQAFPGIGCKPPPGWQG